MNMRDFIIGLTVGASLATAVTVFATKGNDSPANNMVLYGTMSGSPSVLSIATSADGLTVYSATALGFFKSTDGGETWQKLPVK